jgi:hypothetical protein
MADVVMFDTDTVRRIANAVRKVESGSTLPQFPDDTTQTTTVKILKITGALESSTGLYPALAYGYVHTGNGVNTFNELIECRFRPLMGETPAVNDWTLARFSGKQEGGIYGVFVSAIPGEYVRWVKPTSDTSSGGYWPAKLQKKDGSGAYTDDIDVKLLARSGDRFIANEPYLATLNGTTTVSDVVYPLYHANGNQRIIHTVCVEGVERCDSYFYAAPFKIVEDVDCETGEPL